MLPRPLDIDLIYAHGYDCVLLPRNHYETFSGIVHSIKWTIDPEGVFNRIPLYLLESLNEKSEDKAEQEQKMNDLAMAACPSELIDSVQRLLCDESIMNNWLLPYRAKARFISLWDGAEDLDWHWDGPARADFFFLIYLNKGKGWSEGNGGILHMGKRNLDGNFLKVDAEAVEWMGEIMPSSRTIVCCNNQNPQFVHKVTPLSKGDERTVLMIGFDMLRFENKGS